VNVGKLYRLEYPLGNQLDNSHLFLGRYGKSVRTIKIEARARLQRESERENIRADNASVEANLACLDKNYTLLRWIGNQLDNSQ